ncbi:prepilin-type N-terminal cleavage/methylation domain-containing protein [Acetobacterium sp.]|uniref:type IV pilus modification PilV family protein n=1 Tax=Acetobacterium sp. TaxID=1872094 RepID=UPI002F3EC4D1
MNLKNENGYTLVEVIIAIAICGFGLATILGLYGIGFETSMVSKNILDQSLEINSISEDIHGTLEQESLITLSDKVAETLKQYPDYTLEEIVTDDQPDLYIIEISQQGHQRAKKSFFIKVYWRIP